MTFKQLLVLVLAGMVVLGSIAVSSFAASNKYGGILLFSSQNEYPLPDPHRYTGSAQREEMAPVYSTLFQYTVEGTIINDLALGFEVVEPTLFVVTLRPDVQFHDGTPLQANDVLYSFNRILNPETGAQLRSQLSAVIEDIVAEDDLTVSFKLKEAVSPIWFKEITAQIESAILSETWMNAHPDWDYTEHNGSGPFLWDRFVYGVKAVLKRNPNYYRFDEEGNRLPYLDGIEFVGYTDPALRIAAIRAGDLDCNEHVAWEYLDTFVADPNTSVDLPTEAFMDITFNVDAPPFDNKLVRQAIAYAIDRTKVAELAFYGYATPIYGGILGYQPWSWAYNPDTRDRFEYNPDKARELLAQAGYPNGFSAAILTSADDKMHIDTSTVIVEDLAAIGCDITIRLEEWGRRVASGNNGDYEFAISGTGAKMLDPDWLAGYFHGGLGGYYHCPANWNFPEMDQLLDQARVTLDQEERKELYWEWDEMMVDECAEIFLVYRQSGGVRQNWVHGFQSFPGGLETASAEGLENTWLDETCPRK